MKSKYNLGTFVEFESPIHAKGHGVIYGVCRRSLGFSYFISVQGPDEEIEMDEARITKAYRPVAIKKRKRKSPDQQIGRPEALPVSGNGV